jgi:hypothetical protein
MKFHALAVTPQQEPSGVLVYHNTFVAPASTTDLNMQTPASSHYFEIENNLFIAPPTTAPVAVNWTGPIDHGTFDYNGYYPDGIFAFNNPIYGGYFLQPSFAGLQALGMEKHGVLASGPLFASGLAAPTTYTNLMPPADASLASGSIALDRGRVLPNINDNYQGSGPDLGALERGCPAPSYGPRPEGTDESNEVVGCTVAVGPAATGQMQGTAGSLTSASLTSEGSIDWAHWGEPVVNRKSSGASVLGDLTPITTGNPVYSYNNDPRSIDWSDGAPTVSSSGNLNGVFINSTGNGFSLTVPATATTRSLRFHVGGWYSSARLVATLSDGTAAPFTDDVAYTGGQYTRDYVLSYSSTLPGQSINVKWTMTGGGGNVTWNAASLGVN